MTAAEKGTEKYKKQLIEQITDNINNMDLNELLFLADLTSSSKGKINIKKKAKKQK